MADAAVSLLLERFAALVENKVREEVHLLIDANKDVEKLTSRLKDIHQVLAVAEQRGWTDDAVRSWLEKLNHIAYEIDDVLDEWEIMIMRQKLEESESSRRSEKVRSFPQSICSCFKPIIQRRAIALDVTDLNKRLDELAQRKNEFNFVLPDGERRHQPFKPVESTSFSDVPNVPGREIALDVLMSKLLPESSSNNSIQGEDGIQVISLVGAGGMGKTTLAQLAFNKVEEGQFQVKIWICVSDPFDEDKVAKAILEALKESYSDHSRLQELLESINESISGKKFFLVLDDVWTEDDRKWEPLRVSLNGGAPGSRILVTTRNEKVAVVMGSHNALLQRLEPISDSDCWSILRQTTHEVFNNRTERDIEILEETGRRIAEKCKGLPLAAKTMGGLLRLKRLPEEWEDVLKSEIWGMKMEQDVFPVLGLSYNELDPTVKRCFSYCAIFPKDEKIDVDALIRMWMAQGFLSTGEMELKGRYYFADLAMRSLFQDFGRDHRLDDRIISCKMHDIVHDFAQYLTGKECLLVEKVGGSEIAVSHQNTYHLNMLQYQPRMDLNSICSSQKLHSFLCRRGIPPNLFSHLRRVRSLILLECNLEKIPKEIGNLIQLRYLNLRDNRRLKVLPETICNLYKLQTLEITGCRSLNGLPEMIHKLVNLRHLLNFSTSPSFMFPEGFEKLTNLRTLEEFNVTGRGGNKFGSLKHLNLLEGTLIIEVSTVETGLQEDAKKADLKSKMLLRHLSLDFMPSTTLEAIEELQPPPHLRILTLAAPYIPKWMTTTSLTNLRKLLIRLADISSLPNNIGKLPLLEELNIRNMRGMKLGQEFFLGGGINKTIPFTPSSSSFSSSAIFPKLKKLEFTHLMDWSEWEDISSEKEEKEENIINTSSSSSILPCLHELRLFSCGELKALPHSLLSQASSLHNLYISYSEHLKSRYNRESGQDWDKISHIPHVVFK